MKVTLDIQDNKFKTFLEFIKTLDYVSVKKDDVIPQWQMNEVEKRLQDHKKNPERAMDFDAAMDDIEKDL
jgi:hypothetical protein